MESPKQIEPVRFSGGGVTVKTNVEFSAAVATAPPGTVISLDSGSTFGPLTIPDGKQAIHVKPTGESVEVRSDGANRGPLAIGLGCRDIIVERLTLQSTHNDTTKTLFWMLRLGYDAAGQREAAKVDELCDRVKIDRCKILGTTGGALRVGILANATNLHITGCTIRDVHEVTAESQGILQSNSIGPTLIEDCEIEAAGIGILTGGSAPTIPGLQIADMTVRWCTISKKLEWKDPWACKNNLEFKGMARGLVENCFLHTSFGDAQQGACLLLTPRNKQQIADVLIHSNRIKDVAAGIHVAAVDDNSTTDPVTGAVSIIDNTFINVGIYTGLGRVFNVSTADGRMIKKLAILGNAWLINPKESKSLLFFEGPASAKAVKELEIIGNVGNHGQWGILGTNTATGKASLDKWCESYVLADNIFFGGGTAAQYPSGVWFGQ